MKKLTWRERRAAAAALIAQTDSKDKMREALIYYDYLLDPATPRGLFLFKNPSTPKQKRQYNKFRRLWGIAQFYERRQI